MWKSKPPYQDSSLYFSASIADVGLTSIRVFDVGLPPLNFAGFLVKKEEIVNHGVCDSQRLIVHPSPMPASCSHEESSGRSVDNIFAWVLEHGLTTTCVGLRNSMPVGLLIQAQSPRPAPRENCRPNISTRRRAKRGTSPPPWSKGVKDCCKFLIAGGAQVTVVSTASTSSRVNTSAEAVRRKKVEVKKKVLQKCSASVRLR